MAVEGLTAARAGAVYVKRGIELHALSEAAKPQPWRLAALCYCATEKRSVCTGVGAGAGTLYLRVTPIAPASLAEPLGATPRPQGPAPSPRAVGPVSLPRASSTPNYRLSAALTTCRCGPLGNPVNRVPSCVDGHVPHPQAATPNPHTNPTGLGCRGRALKSASQGQVAVGVSPNPPTPQAPKDLGGLGPTPERSVRGVQASRA